MKGTEPVSRRARGRPTKRSNAELELVALKGAITRFSIQAGPAIQRLMTLAGWSAMATESEKKVLAEWLRLLKAKDCPSNL